MRGPFLLCAQHGRALVGESPIQGNHTREPDTKTVSVNSSAH